MKPFDIVHVVHSAFPEDPRVRREAAVAAATGARVAVVALRTGRDARPASRYGPLRVIRLPGSRSRGSALSYLREYLSFTLRVRALFARDRRFGGARVVHVHTLPDFLVAGVPRRGRGHPHIVLDLHEIFPEFTATKFGGALGRLGAHVATRIERWSRRRADVTITVNEPIAALLRGRPAGPGEQLVIVHNLSDPAEFGPQRITSGASGQPVRLVYHGTLTRLYGLDLACEAVRLARRGGHEVEFDIYGWGDAGEELTRRIRDAGLDGVIRLHGAVPHHVLRDALPTYAAGLLATRLDGMTRYSLSTKLLELVHLGIPLIAPRIPTYQAYFPGTCAWYFTPNDAASAAEAIGAFGRASPEERIARAREAQRAASRLSWDAEATRLRGVYDALRDGGSSPAKE